jgi:hypothetical protein
VNAHGREEADKRYIKRSEKMKGVSSLKYFIEKHGEIKGSEIYENKMSAWHFPQSQTSRGHYGIPYSKISQELFNEILIKIIDKENVFYATHNNEMWFDTKKYEIVNSRIYVDFKYNNKIIEFDCDYWHNEENDIKRDYILKLKGFDVLRINTKDYKKDKQYTIQKCVDFLEIQYEI